MCRVLAYLGEPISLGHVLYETDSSLVRQSYSPRMMETFLNLAGFGVVAWDPHSARAREPFAYRATALPLFDRNLRSLADKLDPTCMIAHVRGVSYSEGEMVSDTNLHPFRFRGAEVVLAHNGHLREFDRMRYDLVSHIRPDVASQISGTPVALGPRWDQPRLVRTFMEQVRRGRIDVRSLVTDVVEAADVAAAFERLDQGDPAILQAVLRFPAAPEPR